VESNSASQQFSLSANDKTKLTAETQRRRGKAKIAAAAAEAKQLLLQQWNNSAFQFKAKKAMGLVKYTMNLIHRSSVLV
jgi:hypothetical protein